MEREFADVPLRSGKPLGSLPGTREAMLGPVAQFLVGASAGALIGVVLIALGWL